MKNEANTTTMVRDHIRRRIESIMYEKEGQNGHGPLAHLLHGISLLYGRFQAVRRECYRRGWCNSFRLPCKVVSVGNIAVGGTGKTPMTAYLARTLQNMGQQVVVINRGYKGKGGNPPQVVSDGQQVLLDSLQSGDEAQMLARQLVSTPVMIGADRYRTGLAAVRRFRPHVVLLDDGFQHIRLQRDLDLVLLDRAAPLGNGHLLPRGTLREPVDVLKEPDGIVLTRSNQELAPFGSRSDVIPPEMPVFKSMHRPYHFIQKSGESPNLPNHEDAARSDDFGCLRGVRAALFSGIARNEDFQRIALENGAELVSVDAFPDHHRYSRKELGRIAAVAQNIGADLLMTTEKDLMRLPHGFDAPLDLMVVGIEIDFAEQEAAFREFLRTRLDL